MPFSNKKINSSLLAQVSYPLYTVRALTERHILVAGGGGSAKTGIANCLEIYELIKSEHKDTCEAVRIAHLDTGDRAIMNGTVFHNGRHFILATGGMEGLCVLYQLRLVAHNPKNDSLLTAPTLNDGSFADGLRKRTHSNDHPPEHQLSNTQPDNDDDYATITFDIQRVTSFQADFNHKCFEDSYLKVVRFSPTAKLLATGGSDGHVRLFNYPELKLMHTINAHENDVDELDIDPLGGKLISISKDGRACVWSLRTYAKISDLKFEPPVGQPNVKYSYRSCRFTQVEGNNQNVVLYTAMNPLVRSKPPNASYICKWETNQWKPLCYSQPQTDVFSVMTISDDGRFVGLGTLSGCVEIYIAFSLQKLYSLPKSHGIFVTNVEFLSSCFETKMLSGNHDASLVSISVDNQIVLHHIPNQHKIGFFTGGLFFFIFLFIVFVIFDFLGL